MKQDNAALTALSAPVQEPPPSQSDAEQEFNAVLSGSQHILGKLDALGNEPLPVQEPPSPGVTAGATGGDAAEWKRRIGGRGMTDDLKERLRAGVPITKQILLEGVTFDLRGFLDLQREAIAYITDLEARLAAAEAGEDALAECIRDFLHETGAYRPHERRAVNALAAYEARRG